MSASPHCGSPHLLPFRPLDDDTALTLDQAFVRCKLPDLADRSPETLSEYRTHLARWRQCWESRRDAGEPDKYRMVYPVLPEIGRAELHIFQGWLCSQVDPAGRPRFSPRTVNKHIATVGSVLRAAQLYELVDRLPVLPTVPARKAARKLTLLPEQVDQLMHAAAAADWPRGLPHEPPLYWRVYLVLACLYGFRTQELAAYETRMRPLQWAPAAPGEPASGIYWQAESPHEDGTATSAHGWLAYVPQKQQRHKPDPLVLPLHPLAARWLQAVEPADHAGPVLPFPRCANSFYSTWRAIVERAGIQPKRGIDGTLPQFQPLHLRKTAATWINNHRPGLADYVLGHASDRSPTTAAALPASQPSKVQRLHYDCADARLVEGLTTLPVPETFDSLLPYTFHPAQEDPRDGRQ